jgi:hypothetical protein
MGSDVLSETGIMLAVYLISQGDTTETAIRRVRDVEKAAIETSLQIAFLEEFARKVTARVAYCVVNSGR